MRLLLSENLGSRKVDKVFVISNDVHWKVQTLQVVLSNLEYLKDCKKFFVVNIIIEFQSRKGVGVESNKIDIRICRINRKNSPKCIIKSVSLNNNLGIWYLVCKYQCECKSLFKGCKHLLIWLWEVPQSILAYLMHEWNQYIRVVLNKAVVEIAKA